MRAGERVVLRCTALDDEGASVGEVGGARVHVARSLPGEKVAAVVEHVSQHRAEAWAALERLLEPSDDRALPACPGFGSCGGCVLQHFAQPAQAAWKRTRLREALARYPALRDVEVAETVASPRPLGYRNNARLVWGRTPAGKPALGAFAPRTHDLVDLAGCRVGEPALEPVAGALRGLLLDRGVPAYDERRATGLLRYVVLRASSAGRVQVVLVTARAAFLGSADLARSLGEQRPEVDGVIQNVNPTRGNVLYGPDDVVLAGEHRLEDEIAGVRVLLSPRAFFQANRNVAALAYVAIADAIVPRPGETIADVYSGAGGIALVLARREPGAQIVGIESIAAAAADATESARLSDVHNARFVAGDAAAELRRIESAGAVVLNPPRRGCDPGVLHEVVRLRPSRIAYLACSPDTLARDLASLVASGYRVSEVTPFDMLPGTPHVEALANLAADVAG